MDAAALLPARFDVYKIVSRHASGSVESGPRSVMATSGTKPAKPFDLTAIGSSPNVIVEWYVPGTNEAGFEVERSDNGGAFTLIGTRAARSDIRLTNIAAGTVAAGNT